MSVELDPPELGFRRPFTHEVTQLLRLRNPGTEPIAFKVKTTAPKQYCVRPNSGKIDVGRDIEVQVLLQAMKEDPPPDARCRDKFLVQTVALSRDSDTTNVPAIWQNIEKANKSSIQERKIRVAFLPVDGNASTPSHHNVYGAHLGDEAPPAYGSPVPSFGSPGPDAATPINHSANISTNGKAETIQMNDESVASQTQTTASATVSGIPKSVPTSSDDLKGQLADAHATIRRLKDQTESQGLRQRKTDAVNQDARERITTGTTGMGVQQQPTDGVPVQIVAALCLLSFLLAYILF
ncbi:MAG: hypothetical protein L6R37_002795 [Teloschistes peruensis]|nr:MAG: hypothetical protein L6R37_002795 [Teloschistes peruensis]